MEPSLHFMWTRSRRKTEVHICCGVLITSIAEYLGISLAGLTEDGGKGFIIYEVLFSVGLLKTDYWGQGFFLQVAGDHSPVPIPQLTKVDL